MHRIFIISFILMFTISVFPQVENGYWGKAEISYTTGENYRQRDYTFKNEGAINLLTEAVTKSYWFFISDLDGDNCPFRPSCSEFLQQSVQKTNAVQGTLMFFDRFTRDLNFYNRHNHYSKTPEGYFADPPEKYIF
jgi:putative component of membrane protein insertase Oxa1/YidC/SpoIIIJ protein YidD